LCDHSEGRQREGEWSGRRGETADGGGSLSQDARFACLGVAEVHGLVQELIHNHKVISNAFLFQLSEIIFEHLRVRMGGGGERGGEGQRGPGLREGGREEEGTLVNRYKKKSRSDTFEFLLVQDISSKLLH
jgi:hypothetical protein